MKKEEEAKLIQKALLLYWSCEACKKLGWDKKCQDKTVCGERLYKLLEWHLNKKE